MEENYFKRTVALGVLILLLVLSFLILKPVIMAIITGLIIAFIFNPLYKKILPKIKSQNASSAIICFGLLVLIVLPLWFLVPVGIDNAVRIYFASRDFDFVTPLQPLFSSFSSSESFVSTAGEALENLVTNFSDKIVRGISSFLLNLPFFALQLIVTFFTLFFVLRDKDRLFSFVASLSPFSKEIEKKLIESSSRITASILYGQVIIGTVQGLIAGIGFFIFGVPNALLFTLLAVLAGIFPVIGTVIIWIPVLIYAFFNLGFMSSIGILVFGIISTNIDNFLRPLIIGRRVKVPSVIIMIGMIGGVFYFGILGFILGPLILSYLLIILEGYQFNKKNQDFLLKNHRAIFL